MRLIIFLVLPLLLSCGTDDPGREQVFATSDQVRPLTEGMPAPAFVARHPDGSPFEFDPAALDKPVILFFYRGGWCPYCNAQLMELRRVEKQIEALGYDQVYLSADSPDTLQQGLAGQQEPMEYTVLSDNDLLAARKFGIAFKVDEGTVKRYLDYGIDLEAASGRTHHALPVPSVYIISQSGAITFAYVNPDYRYRLHPDILLPAARASLDGRNVRERVETATETD